MSSYYTPEQQQHLDLLHTLSYKYIGENYDYGNTLSSLRALYGNYYALKNNHERIMKNYSNAVEMSSK